MEGKTGSRTAITGGFAGRLELPLAWSCARPAAAEELPGPPAPVDEGGACSRTAVTGGLAGRLELPSAWSRASPAAAEELPASPAPANTPVGASREVWAELAPSELYDTSSSSLSSIAVEYTEVSESDDAISPFSR